MSKRLISIALLVLLVCLAFLPGIAQAQPAADPVFTWGNGADGDLTIAAGNTFNINTDKHPGRVCANGGDGVSYEVTALTARTATLRNSPSGGCLNVGDEFILMNMQGSSGTTGNNELLRVQNVSANLVTFTTNKTKFYGAHAGDDSGLGSSQHVVLQRVPNYNNVTINGAMIANGWNGTQYGLVVFRVKGNWIGSGNINLDTLGYHGGRSGSSGASQGESWPGPGIIAESANGGGGAGRNPADTGCPGGQGNFGGSAVDQVCTTANGAVYGSAPLDRLYPGSGGGGRDVSNGGKGGGVVYVMANNANFLGTITVKGQDGANTGAGSGGSIRLEGAKVTVGVLNATGGKGANNASAGVGRIAIYYVSSWHSSSAFPPPYSQQISAPPTASATFTPTKTATSTPTQNLGATATSLALTLTAQARPSLTPDLNATGTALSRAMTAQAATLTASYNASATSQSLTATARANPTLTPDLNATGTALSLTMTAQTTPDLNATGTAQSLTMTAQITPDYDATATAQSLTATAQAGTPDFNATGTALSITMTAQAATRTPNYDASATAQSLTATARAGTPDLNATGTALAKTATAYAWTATPSITPTPTATLSPTVSPSPTASSNGNNGTSSGSGGGGGATPTPSASTFGLSGANCAITLNVYVYVDSNADGQMAAQGEGVNSLQVNFLDASFGKVGSAYATNGKASFCVPDYLKGLTLRVDIPYLQRTGTMQAPDDNNKNQPLEMWFRLEPPTLPLFIP